MLHQKSTRRTSFLKRDFEKLEDEIERIKKALMKAGIEIP